MLAISPEEQPFCFCCRSGRVDVSHCGGDCEPASCHIWPVSAALAPIVDYFLGNDIANRCVRCPSDSISFLFADERRLAWKR
jgi:hypothetical protein